MRILVQSVLIGILAIQVSTAWAVRVRSIYEAEVPIASKSEDDKRQAEQDALAQVIVKVSGNAHILENNPNLKLNMQHAEDYVNQTHFNSTNKKPRSYVVRFDEENVNQLLQDAGFPVWREERPLILVWMTSQDEKGTADFIDSTTSPLPTQLKVTAKQRGLPVIFPMLDVADLAHVAPDDIATKKMAAIKAASARYLSNGILLGTLIQAKNEVTSHWTFTLDNDTWSWDVTGKDPEDVLLGIVDNVTDTLANRFGVLTSTKVQADVLCHWQPITHYEDVIRVMHQLEQLSSVNEVKLMDAVDNDIVMEVTLHTTKERFLQEIAKAKIGQLVSDSGKDLSFKLS